MKLVKFIVIFSLFFLISPVNAAVEDEIRERNQQIEELQKQIDEDQVKINQLRSQGRTLENEVSIYNAEIRQIESSIRSLELSINQTSVEINDTESQINFAEEKINKNKQVIAQFLKIINENDQKTLTHILLSNDDLSDFFAALNDLRANQEKLQLNIIEMKQTQAELEKHKNNLEERLSELDNSRRLESVERSNLSKTRNAVNKLLKDTKGEEARFQEIVQKSQKDIAAIKAQIQFLVQSGLTAEDAVKYAKLAAIGTGIRPAFLLALLEYETGLGSNVGKCNLVDITSGSSRHVTTGKVSSRGIHPSRDLPVFISITAELGMDPLKTPISCWPGYGYGGAMGPAQFIPSTWLGYREEVTRITGHNPANPWNFEDAFTASAIYLARRGATAQTPSAEIAAAKAYISGNSKCSTVACNRYANGIQRIAADIEKNL